MFLCLIYLPYSFAYILYKPSNRDHLEFIYECTSLVRQGTLLSPFIHTSQKIYCICIDIMFISHKCFSVLTSWMTSEFHSFNSLKVSYVFVNLSLVSRRSTLCALFIFVRVNYLTMVTICPFLWLFFSRFPAIATKTIISCDPSLHRYTFKLRTYEF